MVKLWLIAKSYVYLSQMVFLLKMSIYRYPYWQDGCHGLNFALDEWFSFTQGVWPCHRQSSKTWQRTRTQKGPGCGTDLAARLAGSCRSARLPCLASSALPLHVMRHQTSRNVTSHCTYMSRILLCLPLRLDVEYVGLRDGLCELHGSPPDVQFLWQAHRTLVQRVP